MTIEADSKRGDEIEFAGDFWQRLERLDPPNDAFHSEQREHFAVKFGLIGIEAEYLVSQMPKNKEEIAGPAPDIQDVYLVSPVEAKRTDMMDSALDPRLD